MVVITAFLVKEHLLPPFTT